MATSTDETATNKQPINTMKALLKTYILDKLTEAELVELPDNYDDDPYGDTVPFCIGSNQTLQLLDSHQQTTNNRK